MNSERVAKVAVIGGGCAAITTAFELSRPEMNGRYVEHRRYTDGSTCAIAITGTRIAFLRSCVNWTFTDQTRGGAQGVLT